MQAPRDGRRPVPVLTIIAVHAMVVFALGAGIPLLWRLSQPPTSSNGSQPSAPPQAPAPSTTDDAERLVARVIQSEELILRYTPRLGGLAKSISNLRLPDFHSRDLFDAVVQVSGSLSANAPEADRSIESVCTTLYHWPHHDQTVSQSVDGLDLWRPLLQQVAYFEHAKFYFVRGRFLDDAATRWETDVGFSARAQTTHHTWWSIAAKLRLTWQRQPAAAPAADASQPPPLPEGSGNSDHTRSTAAANSTDAPEAADWKIVAWHTKKLTVQENPAPYFVETLEAALPDVATRQRARQSIADELVVRAVRDKDFEPPTKYFDQYAFDRHPGVSVVDIDGDGWDDIYAMDRWGRNLLLRNRGDGTFHDVASSYGLDLSDHCSSAIFADFDNDGDPDLFLGRTLERTRYLVNEGGRFVDRSRELVDVELPYLVSSIAAADYNNDGLLDVYISTYAADTIEKNVAALGGYEALMRADGPRRLLEEFLSPQQATELFHRYVDSHMFTSRVGPPNLLLVNRGGRFERAAASDTLSVWRNTYQSTWGDYDNDGDPDLYVANDFSPNHLFRNDGGRFVDVTTRTHTADIGFGMGAAWGDYDHDGRQDLYVSNMFSKAGRRIAGAMRGVVDPTFEKMAGGNTLFRNMPKRFKKVSGLEPPALTVEKAGWSWGGQFLDVDNDGYLDIYVTSGYYSAPPQIAVQVDL